MVNAFTAMINTQREARLLVVHTRSRDGPSVLIEVTDTGTGIDPDKLERIFDPFITSKRDGLGMGLAICRSIIDRHGGKIWAENNREHGATFSITLPAAIANTQALTGRGISASRPAPSVAGRPV